MAVPGTNSAATEHSDDLQLIELVNPEAGMSFEMDLKVIRNEIVDYTYSWQGNQVPTQKLQIVLQSKIAEQCCLGVAKLQKKDQNELKLIANRWQIGTIWKISNVTLLKEKSAYIHTPCRIVIDLRKTTAKALLQSTCFPQALVPTTTIAEILQLQQMQRFDLMAIPAKIIDVRHLGLGYAHC